MFEHSVSQDNAGGVTITVELEPLHHGAKYHKPLAIALLDVLNDSYFQAECLGVAAVKVAVTFHEPPNIHVTPIWGRFGLPKADSDEIQHIAGQAQRFLERRLTEAVDAFNMVLAVSQIDPYKARLHQAMKAWPLPVHYRKERRDNETTIDRSTPL